MGKLTTQRDRKHLSSITGKAHTFENILLSSLCFLKL